ncbi:hypothetical protein FA743_20165 [Paracoccus gahaiensis]|uniref:Uncharacterized protein n=1 Tax=Paracoccus gahaiensis TaxID=1706839 RepID=A0A4V5MWW0_9RHOB|nr:hypothetical protein [Paracoccus gahaiensis]TJZ88258.1 hypothetical protein FA743_20165 [Paracoccus gahaiensis]
MTIIRRGNSLFLRKRVPTRYRRIETRTIVHLSLHTDTGAIAAQKAPRVWSEMIEAWEAKLKGDTGGAEARFAAARELAHIRGVRYLSADAVARLPIEDVLDRTEAVMRASKRGKIDHPPVSGKLSAALLFLYFSGGRDRTMTWDIHRNARRLC